VVKALCLGAKAISVGMAASFGLSTGGAKVVERTFESEMKTSKGQYQAMPSLASRN
jgi:isopentenyl diphosphate isomerase/L-lactate dehydrogenase-like FMN-dependent dehydrogenase